MHRQRTTLAIAGLLTLFVTGCGERPGPNLSAPTVSETRAAVCPRPMTGAELTRAADALDRLPRGADLDYIAAQLERLDDGAQICRGD